MEYPHNITIVKTKIQPGQEMLHKYYADVYDLTNTINKAMNKLKEVMQSLADKHEYIEIFREGKQIATIVDGFWQEKGVDLGELVYEYYIESDTPEDERYKFPETLRLIAEGKGDEIIRNVDRKIEARKAAAYEDRYVAPVSGYDHY